MQRHDHRYPAALTIALILILLGIYRDFCSPNNTGEELFSLAADDNCLKLVNANYVTIAHEHSEIPPRLTPFFFLPVPINKADKELLTTLPGIGPGMADRIIQFRTSNGPILSSTEFIKIPGIGAKRIALLTDTISYE